MILVTVGTHHQPFDRLVRACEELATSERVVVQRGTSRWCPVGCEVHDEVAAGRLARWMAEASAVVCHAGPATIFEALDAGHTPIVVARDPAHGEHVDDHQLRFVARLGRRVHRLDDPGRLAAFLRTCRPARGAGPGAPVNAAFVSAFAEEMDRLASSPRRDRFRRITAWLGR
jgi:UDP-N-acetylglucosamine transferase subunit ALG13